MRHQFQIACLGCCLLFSLAEVKAGWIDRAFAVSISVGNASFETPILLPNSGSGAPAPWIGPVGGGGGAGHFRSGGQLYPNQDGNQLAYLFVRDQPGSFGALFQDITTIAAGTYTLTAGVAKEAYVPPTSVPFTMNIESVGGGPTTLLGGTNFPVGATNTTTLTDLSTSVTVPVGSPEIGRTLRIVLAVNGQDAGGNPNDPRATYNVDKVRLEFTPVPEPGTSVVTILGAIAGLAIRRRKPWHAPSPQARV